MNMEDFTNQLCDLTQKFFTSAQAITVGAKMLGLDERACSDYDLLASVKERFIAVPEDCLARVNYYGGFEYHDEDFKTQIGNYTIFKASEEPDCHVNEALRHLESIIDDKVNPA